MKERASFTFDKNTLEIIDELMQNGFYRNKSHVVEHAVKILFDNINEKRGKKS